MSAIKQIEKQPKVTISVKNLLAVDPSVSCEAYTDPQPKAGGPHPPKLPQPWVPHVSLLRHGFNSTHDFSSQPSSPTPPRQLAALRWHSAGSWTTPTPAVR